MGIDGWDTYRSDSITIQNSYVSNTDDCVSFKPNSTNIVVQNMVCINSHGISVGSLGQYVGEVDIVGELNLLNLKRGVRLMSYREHIRLQCINDHIWRLSSNQSLAGNCYWKYLY